MKILVDENIPGITVAALRSAGHDVLDVRGTANEGASDERLWQMAVEDGRLLITTDKGFLQRRGDQHSGLLIIRLKRANRVEIHRRVMSAVAQFPAESWPGLSVVMRDMVQAVWRWGEKS